MTIGKKLHDRGVKVPALPILGGLVLVFLVGALGLAFQL